ncbi:MAG: hypothetical protein ChlgKO_06660 [Chlamydiales bacterium]
MKKIIFATAGFHFFLLLLMLLSYRPHKKAPPETLLVQTVQLKPPPPPKPKPRPKAKPNVVARKATPKSAPKPKAKPKRSAPPPKENKAKELFNDLEKSLAKLESKPTALPTLKKIELIKAKPNLKETLLATLQRELILPEMGKVQVRLAVDEQGKISIIEFLVVESIVNRKYIEEKLSHFTLPPFEKREESYIITFTNRNTS